jgi:hypothetical protein
MSAAQKSGLVIFEFAKLSSSLPAKTRPIFNPAHPAILPKIAAFGPLTLNVER